MSEGFQWFVHKLKSEEPVGVALLVQLAGRRLNVRTSAKLQECYSEVTQEDDERKSIVQQILHRSRDFLRRIIVPVQGQGGVTLSSVCLLSVSAGRLHLVGLVRARRQQQKRSSATGGAACGEPDWRNPNRVLMIQDSTDRSEGMCENHVNALTPLVNQLFFFWTRPCGSDVLVLTCHSRSVCTL